jgi:hypothetical protein
MRTTATAEAMDHEHRRRLGAAAMDSSRYGSRSETSSTRMVLLASLPSAACLLLTSSICRSQPTRLSRERIDAFCFNL